MTTTPPFFFIFAHPRLTANLDFETGAYFRPEVGDKLLVGGLEPECDHPLQFVPSPEAANPSLTEEHTNLLYRMAMNQTGLQQLLDLLPFRILDCRIQLDAIHMRYFH